MQEIILNNSGSTIRKFDGENENFHINPSEGTNIKFWAVIRNSKLSFKFDAEYENINIECYFLIPAIKNQNVELDIQTNFRSPNTKIIINVIALAGDQASITLNWNLHILDWISKVEARLYEETLLTWDSKYISMIPWLRVDSPDVIASHWAKIQRISPERIFYMQSRWLDQDKAIWMIINSYSQDIVEKMQLDEQQQTEFYSMIK